MNGIKFGQELLQIIRDALAPRDARLEKQERRQDSTDQLVVDLVSRVEALERERKT